MLLGEGRLADRVPQGKGHLVHKGASLAARLEVLGHKDVHARADGAHELGRPTERVGDEVRDLRRPLLQQLGAEPAFQEAPVFGPEVQPCGGEAGRALGLLRLRRRAEGRLGLGIRFGRLPLRGDRLLAAPRAGPCGRPRGRAVAVVVIGDALGAGAAWAAGLRPTAAPAHVAGLLRLAGGCLGRLPRIPFAARRSRCCRVGRHRSPFTSRRQFAHPRVRHRGALLAAQAASLRLRSSLCSLCLRLRQWPRPDLALRLRQRLRGVHPCAQGRRRRLLLRLLLNRRSLLGGRELAGHEDLPTARTRLREEAQERRADEGHHIVLLPPDRLPEHLPQLHRAPGGRGDRLHGDSGGRLGRGVPERPLRAGQLQDLCAQPGAWSDRWGHAWRRLHPHRCRPVASLSGAGGCHRSLRRAAAPGGGAGGRRCRRLRGGSGSAAEWRATKP
mmetsp:Transcript_7248/g.22427  ORF Transcript_7248/g.22427 Transcript_7248/m.22427 type:complete len:444 (-) Transcript_7248:1629-2960(-)